MGKQDRRQTSTHGGAISRIRRQCTLALLLALTSCSTATPDDAPNARVDDALSIVLPRDAEELDPRFVSDPYGIKITRLIFQSLFTLDPISLRVVPQLAEHHRWVSETELEVEIRRGVRFSDGSTLDAEDVVATFEGIVSEELGSRYAGTYARIEEIAAVDAQTIRFVLDAPHATFLTDLEVPIVRSEDARSRMRDRFVGAGPYRITRRAAGRLELSGNPHYPQPLPHPKLRFITIRDDNTRVLRMLGDGGDLAMNAISPMALRRFEQDPRFEVRSSPGVGTTYLGFHTERVPLPLREAIAHGIDRELLIRTKMHGRATLAASWIPVGHWAQDPSLRPRGYAPEDAASYFRERPSQPLVLRVSNDRHRMSVARAIAGMLGQLGQPVVVRPSEASTVIADLNAGRFDLCLLQVPEVFEPHILHWFFASERIPSPGNAGANRWRFSDSALDQALEDGRSTRVLDERREAYSRAQRRIFEGLPIFPLWQDENIAIVRRGTDFQVPRDGRFGTLLNRSD